MTDDLMLQEAIEAIAQGQTSRARDLITRLLRKDQNSPQYWLLMSAAVESKKECVFCLRNVLRIDPENALAKKGLILLGDLPAQEGEYTQIIKKQWEVEELIPPFVHNKLRKEKRELNRLFLRLGIVSIFFLLVFYFSSSYFSGKFFLSPSMTVTPIPWTPKPTATILSKHTPFYQTPPPTFIGPTPLWMMLKATYTPTPLYINTPHPISEAYQAGLRAMNVGDYASMLQFMQQAGIIEPNAADLFYYIGEAYRMMGKNEDALLAYERALAIDENFAPAYLGRARVRKLIDPNIDIADDLKNAIQLDPSFAEARLELSDYLIRNNQLEHALEELYQVEKLMPLSPWLFYFRAQAYLGLGQLEMAIEAADKAMQLDITLLPVYRLLGEIYLQKSEPAKAKHVLEIYTTYVTDDPIAWNLLGQSLFRIGQAKEAIVTFEKAIELDITLTEAIFYRGLAYIELGEGQKAVNDLYYAKRLQPDSFQVNLEFARALFVARRLEDALGQTFNILEMASNINQEMDVYFLRAQIYEELGNKPLAIKDWNKVLDLLAVITPKNEELKVKEQIEKEHLSRLLIKTSTPTPTRFETLLLTVSPQTPIAFPSRTPKPTNLPTITETLITKIPQLTKTAIP